MNLASAPKGTFLHGRPWTSPFIKAISNELDIMFHALASQLFGHCADIGNRFWRHQQTVDRVSETLGRCVKIVIVASFMDSLYRVRDNTIYVLSCRTVYALTRVLIWCLLPWLLRNWKINAKIALTWAHKQFATRVHILFYIYWQYQCI